MGNKLLRALLSVLLVSAVLYGAVYAYVALTSTGEVTVREPLSWVGSNTFSVSLYPQESVSATLTLANASSSSLSVDFITTVTPNPGSKGMSISVPNNLTVPATGQASFVVTVTAGKSAEPGTYSVTIEVDR